jgi:hypothetical protein
MVEMVFGKLFKNERMTLRLLSHLETLISVLGMFGHVLEGVVLFTFTLVGLHMVF